MNTIWILIGFVVFVLLIGAVSKLKKYKVAEVRRKQILTDIEQSTYWKLKKCIKEDQVLLTQVSFSAMFEGKGRGKERFTNFAKIKQKVADYVICDLSFNVLKIIELDDRTHNKEKDSIRDEAVLNAGIETIRFNVKNIPSIDELKELLK